MKQIYANIFMELNLFLLLLSGIFMILSYVAIIDAPILLTNIDISFGTASPGYQYEGAANVDGREQSIWDTSKHNYPGIFMILSYVAIIDAPILLTNIDISFGTASPGYQYEGAANVDGREQSIWDTSKHNYPEKITDRSNGLEKDKQTIFLDIVCCFKAYELKEVQIILCVHHSYNVKDQIEFWIDESLTIQDLIEKMAKELFRQESPVEPGKSRRLWLPEDIVYLLMKNMGSSMLRVLEWKPYPSEELPSNFDIKQLHICKLLDIDFMSPTQDGLLIRSARASLFAAGCFCEISDDFACITLEMLFNMMNSPEVSLPIKLAPARVFASFNCSGSFAMTAYKTSQSGVKWLFSQPTQSGVEWLFSQPINANMWRLVGLVSSAIGLLCYAQSPSFNRLIGRWNIVKFSLYGVFSLAIFTTILFVKQLSPSTQYAQLKTYISFAVLMIISLYSFYYDKAVNGKPEILSLVSNAAFALMSLSLSKLINLGFEIGLFAYFLGCLVVQLWTINWMLIFVAVIFGCPLFVMHSSSHSQEEVDKDQIIDESSGSDPEIGNAGQPDVGNGSEVIIESYPDSPQEVSSEGQVIHCFSDSITEVASSGGDQHVDIILEANSASVITL